MPAQESGSVSPSPQRPLPDYASVAHVARVYDYLLGGTGMPTNSNIHEVAQSIAPQSSIVYVDHDPIVLSHARMATRLNKLMAQQRGRHRHEKRKALTNPGPARARSR